MSDSKLDTKRIDWLADPENKIGQVLLPVGVVAKNLHSLRDAIDIAMAGAYDPHEPLIEPREAHQTNRNNDASI